MNNCKLLGSIAAVILLTSATASLAGNAPADAYLGILGKPVDAVLRTQLELPDGLGLVVDVVSAKSPAIDSVKPGDVLEKVDDQLVFNAAQLRMLVRMHKPGDSVKLTVIRAAKPVEVAVKLGEIARPQMDAGGDQRLPAPADPAENNDPKKVPALTNDHGANGLAMGFNDGTYSAKLVTDVNSHQHLTVQDMTGQVVAEGPVDTEDQFKALPDDVQAHLKLVNQVLYHPRGRMAGMPGGTTSQTQIQELADIQLQQLEVQRQTLDTQLRTLMEERQEEMMKTVRERQRMMQNPGVAAPVPNVGDRP